MVKCIKKILDIYLHLVYIYYIILILIYNFFFLSVKPPEGLSNVRRADERQQSITYIIYIIFFFQISINKTSEGVVKRSWTSTINYIHVYTYNMNVCKLYIIYYINMMDIFTNATSINK